MGSPLGPTLANIFLCHHEENWLKSCPKQFKPSYYVRYVDDIFTLFSSSEHVKKFEKFIGSRHANMNFSFEREEDCKLSFLDVLVSRDKQFSTSLYRKPTYSGLYTNFNSYIDPIYKNGLLASLLFRAFAICSNWSSVHQEIVTLKSTWIKNEYPTHFIDRAVRSFLDKIFIKKDIIHTVDKKKVIRIFLPYIGIDSQRLKSKLGKTVHSMFPYCKLQVIFKSNTTLGSFFRFKDRLPQNLRSLILYKFTCINCNIDYYGKTKRQFEVRRSEHLGISIKTGKALKYNPKSTTAVKEHLRECDHVGTADNFKIIGSATSDHHLCIKESLLIKRDRPALNKNVYSTPLYLFE